MSSQPLSRCYLNADICRSRRKQNDRNALKTQIKDLRARQESLKKELEQLSAQKSTLEGAVRAAQKMLARCQSLQQGSLRLKALAEEKTTMYSGLKTSLDEFKSWTTDLRDQVETMALVGRSEQTLKRALQRIVDALVEQRQPEIRAICGHLEPHAARGIIEIPRRVRDPAETSSVSGRLLLFSFLAVVLGFVLLFPR